MSSSLILGCSRCTKPINWRTNPDEETADWRARRGKTAHRVRREGTAIAVPHPYPTLYATRAAEKLRKDGSVQAPWRFSLALTATVKSHNITLSIAFA